MNARKRNARDSPAIHKGWPGAACSEKARKTFRDKQREDNGGGNARILRRGSGHRHKLSVGVEFVTVMREPSFQNRIRRRPDLSAVSLRVCETCIVHFSATSSPLSFSRCSFLPCPFFFLFVLLLSPPTRSRG